MPWGSSSRGCNWENSAPGPLALAPEHARGALPDGDYLDAMRGARRRKKAARELELEADVAAVAEHAVRGELGRGSGEDLLAVDEDREAIGPVRERGARRPPAEAGERARLDLDEAAERLRPDRDERAVGRVDATVREGRRRRAALELLERPVGPDQQHLDVVAAAPQRPLRHHRVKTGPVDTLEGPRGRLDPAVDRDRELLMPSMPARQTALDPGRQEVGPPVDVAQELLPVEVDSGVLARLDPQRRERPPDQAAVRPD